MSANVTFSLCAACASLLVVMLAAVKGDWAVVAVYLALVVGFLARACLGRRSRETGSSERQPGEGRQLATGHDRRLRCPRFRRR